MRSAALLAAILVFALVSAAAAQTAYDDEKTPEGWALARLRNGETADFDKRCQEIDPQNKTNWKTKSGAPCKQIPAKFVVDVLTDPKYRDQLGQHGMRLRWAQIAGDIDISDAEITQEVWIDKSKIEGSLDLSDSHLKRLFSLDGSTLTGDLLAYRMDSRSSLFLRNHAVFRGKVELGGARIGGDLDMIGSSFAKPVDADHVNIGGDAFMRGGAHFGDELRLTGGRIGRNLEMNGSSFAGIVWIDDLRVTGNVFMNDNAHFDKEIDITGAKTGGDLVMDNSSFYGPIMAERLDVKGMADMESARFLDAVDMRGATIRHDLDLRSSTLTSLDLSEGLAEDLLLEGVSWRCAGTKAGSWPLGQREQAWRKAKCGGIDLATSPPLILRNFHAKSFQDGLNAWPASVDLEGFRYDRLGDMASTQDVMRARTLGQWIDLLHRQRDFSTQPYTQLAKVLFAAGQQDTAEKIQFAERQQERKEALRAGHLRRWLWMTFLSWVLGYGIGLYTFRVLRWVLILTLVGSVVLWWSPPARRKGLIWIMGASLHRLLPVIELSKEFTDFFDSPSVTQAGEGRETRNLNGFQQIYFAAHALMGWTLGFFLVAAMSGLTQK